MPRSRSRTALLILLAAACLGGIGAAGGFVIGRRWPIDSLDRFLASLGPQPTPVWREFARTDLPRYEAAKVVQDGTLYIAGGFWTSDPKATARVDALDLASGAWRRMKDMPVALTHAPPAEIDGIVWLAGGFEGDHPGPATARVWRWDPRRDEWSEGPSLPAARGSGALVALDRTLHYFGGFLPDRNTDSADHWILEPGAAAWVSRAPMPHPRGHLEGIVLDGRIYAISGNSGHDPVPVDVPFVDRYDPATDTWTAVPPPPFPLSHDEESTFVYDGRIVMVGGRALTEGRWNQDEVISFNPATGRWTHLNRIPIPLLGAIAFPLDDTIVAGLGATHGNNPNNPLLWQAALRETWHPADPIPEPIGEVAGGVVDGALYLVGEGTYKTWRLDLATGRWDDRPAFRPAAGHHQAAEVIDGRLWLFGGLGGGAEGLVQIYEPVSREWTLGPAMPFAAGSSASAVIDGAVYVAGGIVGDHTTAEAARLDLTTLAWTPIAPMPRPRNHAASATDGERLYVFGGRGPGSGDANVVANGYDDVQIYDPRTDAWTVSDGSAGAPAPLPQARGGMGKAVWMNGEFWVMGGETIDGAGATPDHVYDRVDIYDPRTNTWRAGPPLRTARHGIFPVAYEGQIIVAGGGVRSANSQSMVTEQIWPKPRR
ncbi:MAG: kelch repeat-containing protein [Vicinamibacterales bacterium]